MDRLISSSRSPFRTVVLEPEPEPEPERVPIGVPEFGLTRDGPLQNESVMDGWYGAFGPPWRVLSELSKRREGRPSPRPPLGRGAANVERIVICCLMGFCYIWDPRSNKSVRTRPS